MSILFPSRRELCLDAKASTKKEVFIPSDLIPEHKTIEEQMHYTIYENEMI